ncbi:MAG TPA: 2-amino-4-hydroxy-6-hydroxymethyldihydropteridine diphosphokinase [Verrucomicrobiae bacterium]|nr:2-amino-4-hydroxy-6-hydroxymethyldihydropteridine diphosphokinase [Verrucomicrobiae bacterium]
MPIKSPFDIPKLQFELQKLAFIALGSNLGDSKQNVLQAMERLQAFSDFPLLRSSVWQTTPVDCPPESPLFVNAVVGLLPRTMEVPESLLAKLQAIEKDFGRRTKKAVNEPRPLDMDLIAFRQETRGPGGLSLPHPRAHLRRFVLQPLSEIAPDLVLPRQILTVRQLLETLDASEKLIRLI